MRLEIAPEAANDLLEISYYIAQDKPSAAERWLKRIYDEIKTIGRNPLLFPVERKTGLGFRQAPFGRYLILFRVTGELVRIERVLHGMRDLPQHLQ